MITLKIGDKAPNFNCIDQDGNPIQLSDYKGKKGINQYDHFLRTVKMARGANEAGNYVAWKPYSYCGFV